jgi:uncharacterized protein YkwD
MASRILTPLLGLLLLVSAALVVTPAATASPAPEAARAVALKPALQSVLRKVNAARARHDVAPLKVSSCLTGKFAQPWARHMAGTGNLVHQDLGPMLRTCSGFHRVGENIASGYPTAGAVMKAWMNSPGHRRNILRPGFTRIGLGLATSEGGTRFWVQDFGG